jgi:murein L,D-transpeptidase YafK
LREKGKKFFPVHIFPFKLDKILDEARKERSGDEEVLKFWKNIEPAFDYFEKHKKLPKFRFGNEGEYIFDLPSGTK